jgi:hypothetical protein
MDSEEVERRGRVVDDTLQLAVRRLSNGASAGELIGAA